VSWWLPESILFRRVVFVSKLGVPNEHVASRDQNYPGWIVFSTLMFHIYLYTYVWLKLKKQAIVVSKFRFNWLTFLAENLWSLKPRTMIWMMMFHPALKYVPGTGVQSARVGQRFKWWPMTFGMLRLQSKMLQIYQNQKVPISFSTCQIFALLVWWLQPFVSSGWWFRLWLLCLTPTCSPFFPAENGCYVQGWVIFIVCFHIKNYSLKIKLCRYQFFIWENYKIVT